jgi:tungstate transport system substrate-binding protein
MGPAKNGANHKYIIGIAVAKTDRLRTVRETSPLDKPAGVTVLTNATGRMLRYSRLLALLPVITGAAACGRFEVVPLLVGSTTSVHDSGLLDELIPAFEDAHPSVSVRVLAVGTGQALALGRRRDVDVLLVHAPDVEREFVRQGYGLQRAPVMRNDYVVAGPPPDPAAVRESGSAIQALASVAAARERFVSRGDDSGTHRRELSLWRAGGLQPAGDWYEEVGQAMGATLLMANERRAYVLTDRATLTSMGDGLDLRVLLAGDSALVNIYSVIEVAGAANPVGACLFSRWLRSAPGKERIRAFGLKNFGESLFSPLPAAGPVDVHAEDDCREIARPE